MHQQPPNPMPLCFSARRAKASHVEASSGLIAYSLMPLRPLALARPTEGAYARGARIAEHASLDRARPGVAQRGRIRPATHVNGWIDPRGVMCSSRRASSRSNVPPRISPRSSIE